MEIRSSIRQRTQCQLCSRGLWRVARSDRHLINAVIPTARGSGGFRPPRSHWPATGRRGLCSFTTDNTWLTVLDQVQVENVNVFMFEKYRFTGHKNSGCISNCINTFGCFPFREAQSALILIDRRVNATAGCQACAFHLIFPKPSVRHWGEYDCFPTPWDTEGACATYNLGTKKYWPCSWFCFKTVLPLGIKLGSDRKIYFSWRVDTSLRPIPSLLFLVRIHSLLSPTL